MKTELSEPKAKIIEYFTEAAENLEAVLQVVVNNQSIFRCNKHEHLICNLIEKKFIMI